jgi:hypothetical protein
VEILQVRGLPVLIRHDLASLPPDVQRLALGGPGYLGLNRGCLGPSRGCLRLCRGGLRLGRVVDLDGGLMQISGEDVRGTVVRPEAILASSSAVSL